MFWSKKKNSSKRRIRKDEREIHPQEVLLDSLAQRKKYFGQKRFEVPLKKGVMHFFFFFFTVIVVTLSGKAVWLCFGEGKRLEKMAEANYKRTYFERSERGVIYDRDMNQLVFNETSFSLACYKRDLPREDEWEELAARVSELIGENPSFVIEKMGEEEERVLVKENLPHGAVVSLKSEIEDLPGFYLKENPKRRYVDGEVFSHIIGFLGRAGEEELKNESITPLDYVGKSGVEKSYDLVLQGEKERRVVEKDTFMRQISEEFVEEGSAGESLVLTIDADLQKKSFEALSRGLERTGSGSGAVVAMNPQTGEVLSLVSLPSFDNNLFFEKMEDEKWKEVFSDPLNPFWNRVVSATYPTGSTIKPLLAAAALEENIISPERSINCKGQIVIENPWHEDQPWIFHDWTTHGITDIRKAIAQSCNVYFYTIGGGYEGIEGLGVERIKKYLNLFGWGEETGIDLPGERSGLIPDPAWKKERLGEQEGIWMPGDTYNLSIGQGYLSINPLQVATAISAIANDGKVLKPRLVREVLGENKEIVERFEPVVKRENFIDESTLEVVKEGMRDAVIYGSSTMLSDLPVRASAKTGTAQTEREREYHNWVTVFAPYEDPEIVLTVMIEYVPEEQVAALPVAREILNWYFSQE